MRMLTLIILFLFSSNTFAIDLGDGSDGSCDISGVATTQITTLKKSYQCTTLTINGNLNSFRGDQAGALGSILSIKVLGAVIMNAGTTIDLSGSNGTAGSTGGGSVLGGIGGAGGSSGGNGTTTDGLTGIGIGAGSPGIFVNKVGASSYGGGGGGGSYKTVSGNVALIGDSGVGGVAGTAGSNGSTYGSEASFESSFGGGSGGAAGGGGVDGGSATHRGSSGGGGGGAILIAAGGNITINGSILSNGGTGGGIAATANSGGGGGGSGGSIWLMSQGNIVVSGTGTINATGGVGGVNDSGGFSGNGGDGGTGRIRLDDSDGVIANSGTISPAAYSSIYTPTVSGTNSLVHEYKSAISCGRVELESDSKKTFSLVSFIFGLLISLVLTYRKKI